MKKPLHLAIAITLLFAPYISFAQPDLGTTADFVFFTSGGAVGNTGISQLTGNVGTNSGAITIFVNVNGVIHNGDGAAGTAAADLADAYIELDEAIPTSFHAPLLGGGEILNAGVYSIAGNTTIDQTLILDGQGNPNAVFIFQVSAPLSTTASSQVSLINNAQACNVFWKVEGLVSLGSSSTMRGTIVANNAAINLSDGVTLEGRALSTTGGITTDGVLAFVPTGCGSPILAGPAAPALGSTACYALFTANGALINDGITNVIGDVGTNVGLTTGFDPLNVDGIIHPIPDVSTATCAADLLIVYDYLNLLAPDIQLLFPEQLGNDLVLTPHTYTMSSEATFTGTLNLDARDNPNAVFVMQINGALSTSTFANVALLNQAKASNVYWLVQGAVTINDNSTFKGTIVSNNGAIILNTGVALEGRVLTTDGAFNTFAITTTMVPSGCITLPVSWLYFRGKPSQEKVLLEWSTANETNNVFFTIEKSTDGIQFKTLATINSIEGNGNTPLQYAFTDQQPYTLGYYRISQTDKDGRKKYFNTIMVKMTASSALQVKHYTRGNFIDVQIAGANAGNGSIELYSMEGKKIATQKILLAKAATTYTIARPLHAGIYLVYVKNQNEKIYTGKMMVE